MNKEKKVFPVNCIIGFCDNYHFILCYSDGVRPTAKQN